MAIKFILLISLFLVLILNFLQNYENFTEVGQKFKHLNSLLDDKINNLIGESSLKGEYHESKIKDHQTLLDSKITETKTNKYSLTQDKILITLFYDNLDEHSIKFYDDIPISEKTYLDFPSPTTSDSDTSMLSTLFKFSDGSVRPWNIFKEMIKNNQDVNPYLNPKLIHIEEVECSVKEMEKCHTQPAKLEPITNPSPSDLYAEQPVRDKNLVDKLPKILVSIYVPLGEDSYNHIQIEYDGIYSIFNLEKPINLYNIIKFLQETSDRHLEIKDIDTDDEEIKGESEIVKKMVIHFDKYHNDETQEKTIAEKTGSYILLNPKKVVAAPLYNDFYLYKCKYCAKYIKSKDKLPAQ